MAALVIDVHDAALTLADESGVRVVEPGFALVERDRIVTGSEARSQARLKPRQTSHRHWAELSLEPVAGAMVGKSSAELAFAQLDALWRRFGQGADDVVLVVPGAYHSQQLGLLLGLAQECGMPVRALVDAAVAASHRPYPSRQVVYVDAGLHRVTATAIDQGADAGVRSERALTQTGLLGLHDAFARRISEMFVSATRFDPFHHAATEQALYDRLPAWLAALHDAEEAELTLTHGTQEFRVTVPRAALLGAAAGFYRAVAQLVAQQREPGQPLAVLLSDRLAMLPGLVAELDRLDDTFVEPLPAGHAAVGALLAADDIAAPGEQVKLRKRLPWRAEAASAPQREAPARATAPANGTRVSAPTHVVYAGTAYRVGPEGLVVGREAEPGRRTIVVNGGSSGVSRAHCEIALRDGELKVKDLSRYGTFVNEKRISGETALARADVIRIGSPGAELHIVELEAGS
jgi:hypothetical protein